MHLINCSTRQLEEFIGSKIPEYAILSHTWGKDEVSYAEIKHNQTSARLKRGYRKIEFTREQALLDGLQYVWVDTCCIDKSSSAELSEAINSMFRWYENAKVCYVYLSDVTTADFKQQFPRSRWFTRGWTLQELLAPTNITFYDDEWKPLGTKIEYTDWLHEITRIDKSALIIGPNFKSISDALDQFCCAQKMAWASLRQTTREEDIAYSLIGIFKISMPLLYGEGIRAFRRLQETIIRQSGDDTILAWGLDTGWDRLPRAWHVSESPPYQAWTVIKSFLAESPRPFVNCGGLRHAPRQQVKMTLTNLGLEIEAPILPFQVGKDYAKGFCLALLSCMLEGSSRFVGIILSSLEMSTLTDRLFCPVAMENEYFHAATVDAGAVTQASVQNISISPSSFLLQSLVPASAATTHILMSPSVMFMAAGWSLSDAKGLSTYEGHSIPNPPVEARWVAADNELIVRSATFEGRLGHDCHILLWIMHVKISPEPRYRIQLCTTCGVYIVSEWHEKLRSKNKLPGKVHVATNTNSGEVHVATSTNRSDQSSLPAPDCIFRLKLTKRNICQRKIMMVDIDLGNLLREHAAEDLHDGDGGEPKRPM